MDSLGASSPEATAADSGVTRCVYCLEAIHQAAAVCPHCRTNLVPLQRLSDERAALERRVAALEDSLATLHATGQKAAESATAAAAPAGPNWPHMVDNIFRAARWRCR
jgi:hypothetical protein